MNDKSKLKKQSSTRLAWQIVVGALVLFLLLPPGVIGILMYRAAAERTIIERIKKLGADVTVEATELPDDDASLGEKLQAWCRVDQVAYVEVAAPFTGDLDELVATIAALRMADSLEFRGVKLTDEHLRQLSRIPVVTSLDVPATDITDAGIAHLQRFRHLKWLDLQCTAVSDAGVDAIGRTGTLETVVLHNSRITDAGAQRLRRLLPNANIYSTSSPSVSHWRVLRELMKRGVHVDVRGTYPRDADGIRVHSNDSRPWTGFDWNQLVEIDGLREVSLADIDAEAAMVALERCPALQHLSLAHVKLDRAALGRVANCALLRVLNLDDCQIEAGGLSQLSKLANLERLRVKEATIDAVSICSILSLDRLTHLHLWKCEIDNPALAHAAAPDALESLCLWESNFNDEGLLGVMRWPGLIRLDASWTKVTGATLDQVKNPSPKLASIELLDTAWTDQGMQQLARWKNLEEFNIVGTKVTVASIDAISSLPKLKKIGLPDALLTAEVFRKWGAAASDAKSAGDNR